MRPVGLALMAMEAVMMVVVTRREVSVSQISLVSAGLDSTGSASHETCRQT